jgi:hypothetical protein
LFTWVANHLGLTGLAVTGALAAGAWPAAASWALIKLGSAAAAVAVGVVIGQGRKSGPSRSGRVRVLGAVLAASGAVGLAVAAGGLMRVW